MQTGVARLPQLPSRSSHASGLEPTLIRILSSRRTITVLALSALVVACADAHPLAPSGPVVGRWGGVDADLVSLAQSVRLRLPCGTIDFASPIAPAATGVFTVQSLGRGGTDTRPLAPAILQGRVTGAAMQITVTYLLPATQRTATYELSRDRAPVFETVCPP